LLIFYVKNIQILLTRQHRSHARKHGLNIWWLSGGSLWKRPFYYERACAMTPERRGCDRRYTCGNQLQAPNKLNFQHCWHTYYILAVSKLTRHMLKTG